MGYLITSVSSLKLAIASINISELYVPNNDTTALLVTALQLERYAINDTDLSINALRRRGPLYRLARADGYYV